MKLVLALTAVLLAGCASTAPTTPEVAGCITTAQAEDMAKRYAALEPLPNPDAAMTMEQARCGAAKFAQAMTASQGKIVGYKAGLTNPAVQQRFNTPHPIAGPMFEKTFLQDGAKVPAKFGARPLFEADLVVEVGDAAINNAKDIYEVHKSVAKIYPFIEMPDLMVQDPSKLAGPQVQMINVGPRLGVLGKPFSVAGDKAAIDSLATMTVKLLDAEGKAFDEGKGAAILNHPYNAVIWLAGEMKSRGIALKKGDLLSLGSFTRLHPPKPGMTVKAVYEGVSGAAAAPSATVTFQ
ncbi:MAG: 2-keto-4-pentenoate hydratase [Burkholderiaceae bacterium]